MDLGKRRKLALLSTSRKIERRRFHEFNRTRESQQWRCRFLSRITTTPSRIVRATANDVFFVDSQRRSLEIPRQAEQILFSEESLADSCSRHVAVSRNSILENLCSRARKIARGCKRRPRGVEEDWTFVGCSFDSIRETGLWCNTCSHIFIYSSRTRSIPRSIN